MKILTRLREETAELHKALEGENLANKIMDHSISREEYRNLLFQNYIAYKKAETEIAKYLPVKTEKTAKLSTDLEVLGVKDQGPVLDFSCNNEAEAIGAAYVIEGSAMGGLLIGKEIKDCDSLTGLPDQVFFSGTRDSMKGWNEYLKFLRSREFTDAEIDAAASKAKETFLLFERAFQVELSGTV
ncbi:biliverdin-producing heme oxygenase [Gramella aestuarii]|uniref:Biliverdin-producing heme oxygenase n=2 Tax=Christiangramia aestuarii TaxID=1028746 RepID=A0A7M3SWN8_9FLAO|nr:biliverdin-producing heme oxygenase [Christiangramia aestuarii]